MSDNLAQTLSTTLNAPITRLRRLTAGASMETYAFTAGDRDLILRRAPGGTSNAVGIGGIPLATEAALIRIAGKHGVTVPDIIHVFAPDSPIGAAYVMNRLPGEALPHKLFKDEPLTETLTALPDQLAREMASIHAIPTDQLPDSVPLAGASELIAAYHTAYESLNEKHPIFELAFHWLRTHCPDPVAEPTLIHGDFRMGNLLIDKDGLTAVLDWEIAHLGDPHQDLAYICAPSWRFGRRDKAVGGIGQIEPFLKTYETASGLKVDPARFQFWRVLTTLFWGSACMTMLGDWREGRERTIERAAIGRRISEVEIDLLLLLQEIEGVEPGPLPPIAVPARHMPTGQTHLSEIISALKEWNAQAVMATAKGRDLFQSRIAANLLGQLEREAQMGRDFALTQRMRLKSLDLTPGGLNAGLANGSIDWRKPDIHDHLRQSAIERLLIDQPHYHGLTAARDLWFASGSAGF